MDSIFVTGHRNPDTDSIVSAMAYAALQNALGSREYVAARLGNISDETQIVLDKFAADPPALIHTMRTQVRDLDFDTPPLLSKAVTISRAWNVLQADDTIPALPVVDDDGHLYAMLTQGDIASFDIRTIEQPVLEDVPMFNLLGVLEGHILNEADDSGNTVSGEVIIALPKAHGAAIYNNANCILLCGQQPGIINRAIKDGVKTLILCQAELDDSERVHHPGTTIISTPYDVSRAARLIYHSVSVHRICKESDIPRFHLDDYLDDVQEIVTSNRHRSYPILDEEDRVVGTLSRYHMIRPRRKRVVLVDHNETAQSVPGLDQAEVLAIIDHHRLADIETTNPVYFRNEPVGSTATIISGMYQEKGIMPTEKMAGLLAAAIVSDTVMFKSPTCTDRDRRMAEYMARISGVSLDELGKDIFASSTGDNKTASELLMTDFKEFHIAGHTLGVGQVTSIASEKLMERADELIGLMGETLTKRGYDMILLMLTDVLREGTQLLCIGGEDIIEQAFNVELKDHTCFLPHVMSRKKQIIPTLSALWG